MKKSNRSSAKIYFIFALIVFVAALFGFILGALGIGNKESLFHLLQHADHVFRSLGPWWFAPSILSLIFATLFYLQGRRHIPHALEEDDAFQHANCRLGLANALVGFSTCTTLTAMALSYSSDWGLLQSVFLLVLCFLWSLTLQARTVQAIKLLAPEKQGNLFDRRFQRDWYESCDEAERQQIAQCSFRAFKVLNAVFPCLLTVLAIFSVLHLISPGYGILVGGLWMIQHISYTCALLKSANNKK